MSELINTHDNRATIRWKLLTGVSALALTAYVSSAGVARAEDTDRPQVWIELGGQLEMEQGLSNSFTAPFMATPSTTYPKDFFSKGLKPARFAKDLDGKITFQPENSDWIFSAGVRYGRSLSDPNTHDQGPSAVGNAYKNGHFLQTLRLYAAPFGDIQARKDETHEIVDFSAGKDVGLGAFGHDASSNIDLGVRFADFTADTAANIKARPNVTIKELQQANLPIHYITHPVATFHQYTMSADAARSFKGIGPSLSWNASAAIAGNKQDGELSLDWGIDASVLFGRQKAKTSHGTKAYEKTAFNTYYLYYGVTYARVHSGYHQRYLPRNHHDTRSRSVTVPNVGGFVGLSVKYPNVKFSVGYRYDTFLNAMDTGIDAAKKSNLTFNGPYLSFSVGLGD